MSFEKYIDERIEVFFKDQSKWNTTIINTPHESFIKDFGTSVFTNAVRAFFTKKYLSTHVCSDCGSKCTERCHGPKELNQDRLSLIRITLETVYPDISKEIKLRDILIEFFKQHKNTNMTFKCKTCHEKETSQERLKTKKFGV